MLTGLKSLGMAEDVWLEIEKTLEQFGDRDSHAPGKQLARAQFLQVTDTLHLKYFPCT